MQLLSTELPQRGLDRSGILGFLIFDIRAEIKKAAKQTCHICRENYASIQCKDCKDWFHLQCARQYDYLTQFVGEFQTTCDQCFQFSDTDTEISKCLKDQITVATCYICLNPMGFKFNPIAWIFASSCCHNGFIHRTCMQLYAESAGYYSNCPWCKSKSFRERLPLQGIFVPDRKAEWEGKMYYLNLYKRFSKCSVENCKCPKGREFRSCEF